MKRIYIGLYEEGSETMYQLPKNNKYIVHGKDIVQTQSIEICAYENKLSM